MIVLDASVLIALFDARDLHHRRTERFMAEHLDEPMTISPISQAEVLVRAVREGRDEAMLADIRSLGISSTALPDDAGQRRASVTRASAAGSRQRGRTPAAPW